MPHSQIPAFSGAVRTTGASLFTNGWNYSMDGGKHRSGVHVFQIDTFQVRVTGLGCVERLYHRTSRTNGETDHSSAREA
jgi:hypothetical protein